MTTENKKILTPAQSIQKSYLRQPVDPDAIEKFRHHLSILLSALSPTDKEGVNKGRVKTFLENTHWPTERYEVNESVNSNADLVIRDKNLGKNVALFEFKRVNSQEMVSLENLVQKALFELVFYYILEEHDARNTNLKHLVISDGYKYFIFEKGLFWELFGKDKVFVDNIMSSERNSSERRDYIYRQIIKPKVESVKEKLAFTYVDIETFRDSLSTSDINSKTRFKALYKLFSPTHLQKLAFSEDHNTLNKSFYAELLYIMGLEERGDKHQIQRLKDSERQDYSLIEQTYAMLNDYDAVDSPSLYGKDDRRFETALGLSIIWINRTLFMKLLESQLISFNANDRKYAFFEKITDFAIMHYLFCKVMAIPESERSKEMRQKFGEVPYLNSSLFELSDFERHYFPISSLRNGEIDIMKGTCLRNNKGKEEKGKIQILDYLKRFLDSYDFGAHDGESGKTIINASVLGLIFEKINGYKDGSFFTPGYVTSYLCRNALRSCVTDKYNDKFGTSYKDFNELAEDFDYTVKSRCKDVNDMINSIRVCDPAVGSGHFLVSALNELIAIKRDLNILRNRDGRRFVYNVTIEDDELIVTDADGELQYNPNDVESQMVQETLFEEKRIIIENCLFGVDINHSSVEICHLRLWIELLKNAYYIKKDDGSRYLQTLPNIDINIKYGNSLVMKYNLESPISQVLRGANISMSGYRRHVSEYKNCPSKETKRVVEQDIAKIKVNFDKGHDRETSQYKKWVQVCSEILKRDNSLFPSEEEETKKLMELRKQEAKLRQTMEDMTTRYARLKSFEWRYEFPEILDDNGRFLGFDCIIGNPPYGVSIQGEYRKTVEEKLKHVPDYEIYYFFISLGRNLLRDNGYLAYIIPNTWLFNQFAQSYRESLVEIDASKNYVWNIKELLDCTNIPIFEAATVRNVLVIMQKSNESAGCIRYKNTRALSGGNSGKEESRGMFFNLVERDTLSMDIHDVKKDFSQNWGLAFSLSPEENILLRKIEDKTIPLEKCFTEISQGIIAYDKLKGVSANDIDNRIFHSDVYKDGFKKWLRGFDVSKYNVTWNSVPVRSGGKQTDREVYVDYDKIPRARERKYFQGKRMLVREITNPSIFAAITEEELYNDPAVLIVKDSENYSLELACGILNSRLASFYHFRHSPKATKGAFPKIMISDIRSFPLPVIVKENIEYAERIEKLVSEIQREKAAADGDSKQIALWESQIDDLVYRLYGLTDDHISLINDYCD